MTLEELSAMHWATLKKMVEDAGGTYENKEKSIQFLLGDAPIEEPAVDAPIEENLPIVTIEEAVMETEKKSVITLDKSKAFGQIFGDVEGYPNAAYSQGEHLFNSRGEKI